jgi:hypothetical protein
MSENLHDKDRLEEFLRKSLEGYTENPPGDLWERIEGALPPASPIAPWLRRWWWWAGGIAIGVAALFIIQQIMMTRKVEQLKLQIKQTEQAIQELNLEKQQLKNVQQDEIATPDLRATTTRSDEQVVTVPTTETPSADASTPFKRQSQMAKIAEGSTQKRSSTPGPKSLPAAPAAVVEQEILVGMDTGVENVQAPGQQAIRQVAPNENVTSQCNKLPVVEKLRPAGWPSFGQSAGNQAWSLSVPQIHMPTARRVPGDVGAFSVGLRAVPTLAWQQIEHTGDSVLPPPPQNPTPRVQDDNKNFARGGMVGVAIRYDFNQNWRLSSGLNYQVMEKQSTHLMQFRHGQGNCPTPGGNIARDCEFKYNLGTTRGDAAVTVRVEQVDSSLFIPQDEILPFRVNTIHRAQSITVPVEVGYRFGTGKLQLGAEAGFNVSFMIDDELSVEKVQSLNQRFRPRIMERPRGRFAERRVASVDLLAGLSIDYALSRRLSLSLEPTLMFALTDRTPEPFLRSKGYAVGVGAGIFYRI